MTTPRTAATVDTHTLPTCAKPDDLAWQNWAGNRRCQPSSIATPRSVQELQELVVRCSDHGTPLRPVGSGHSFAALVTTHGTIVDLSKITGLVGLDTAQGTATATVRAGTRLSDFTRALGERGYALANQGDIDAQTVAGAVSTGTHGTGRAFGNLSSAVCQLKLVTSDGVLRSLPVTGTDDLAAAALSLGLLGVITEVTLAVIPKYLLREETRALSWYGTRDSWSAIESTTRNAEFYWLPSRDMCVVKTFTQTDDSRQGDVLAELPPPGTVERYLTPTRTDWSWRAFPSVRTVPFVECEISVPVEHGLDALDELRALMRIRHPQVTWAVEYRTQAPDGLMLSPTQQQEVATISVHDETDADDGSFLADAEALLLSWGGRPHWGKLHTLGRDEAERRYPRLPDFRAIRNAYDASGLFLNDQLAELFE